MQAFNHRDGPRRLTFVWRNSFVSPVAAGMLHRGFPLAREGLSGVRSLWVVKATVYVSDANWAVAERQLLALTVNRTQQEVVYVADPAVAGGDTQRTTCTCVLAATTDGGLGSYAFTYAPPTGRHLVVDRGADGGMDVTLAEFDLLFPLWPELPANKVLQVVVELEVA